ncbi:MAG: tetratricopeptide repeat protein [Chloroflexi bacterium]|nr:tetratricopeptide repeat protein [Chloroflexota bacterium]
MEHYTTEELKTLCFNLHVDYDELETSSLSKAAKARELILYLDRRERLEELVERCTVERPKGDWQDDTSRFAVDAVLYSEPRIRRAPRLLVGRDHLLVEVHGWLDQNKRVLLTGLPGIGKSALAAVIANQRIAAGKGQVIWLEARHAETDTLLEGIAGCLDKKTSLLGLTGAARIDAIYQFLEKSLANVGLIVFDDVWNSQALYVALEAIPQTLPVLVTSRQRLPVDEFREVTELALDEALKLLSHHAGRDYTTDESATHLCARLGYHPYALEIAGATLKVDEVTPGKLLSRITNAPHNLSMPSDFSEQGRESVKDLLDDSFNVLDELSQTTVIAFGSFYTPRITLALLTIYMRIRQEQIISSLDVLRRRSLVMFGTTPDSYYMHDLTFSYAREQFIDKGGDFQQAVAAVDRYVSDHILDYDGLELELPNILGATGIASDPVALVRIMSVIAIGGYPRPQGPSYLDQRGHTLSLLQQLDKSIAAAYQMGPEFHEPLHYLLYKRGSAYVDQLDLNTARKTYEAALELAPNTDREVRLLALIGWVIAQQGLDSEAQAYSQRAYDLAKSSREDGALSYVLSSLSTTAGRKGDYEAALKYATEAVVINRRLGDQIALGFALLNQGSAELDLGRHEAALSIHQEAYAIAAKEGDNQLKAYVTESFGEDFHASGDRDKAQQYFEQARALCRQFGDLEYESHIVSFMKEHGYQT